MLSAVETSVYQINRFFDKNDIKFGLFGQPLFYSNITSNNQYISINSQKQEYNSIG